MAETVKGLKIVLDADVGGLKGKLGEISKKANELGKSMEKAGKKIQGVADAFKPISTAAAAVGAGMLGAAYKSVTLADDLNTLAKQTGFTTEEIQQMRYAADLVDVYLRVRNSFPFKYDLAARRLLKQVQAAEKC